MVTSEQKAHRLNLLNIVMIVGTAAARFAIVLGLVAGTFTGGATRIDPDLPITGPVALDRANESLAEEASIIPAKPATLKTEPIATENRHSDSDMKLTSISKRLERLEASVQNLADVLSRVEANQDSARLEVQKSERMARLKNKVPQKPSMPSSKQQKPRPRRNELGVVASLKGKVNFKPTQMLIVHDEDIGIGVNFAGVGPFRFEDYPRFKERFTHVVTDQKCQCRPEIKLTGGRRLAFERKGSVVEVALEEHRERPFVSRTMSMSQLQGQLASGRRSSDMVSRRSMFVSLDEATEFKSCLERHN